MGSYISALDIPQPTLSDSELNSKHGPYLKRVLDYLESTEGEYLTDTERTDHYDIYYNMKDAIETHSYYETKKCFVYLLHIDKKLKSFLCFSKEESDIKGMLFGSVQPGLSIFGYTYKSGLKLLERIDQYDKDSVMNYSRCIFLLEHMGNELERKWIDSMGDIKMFFNIKQ